MSTKHFGEHITIDGYLGDPVLLNDKERVLSALTTLCKEQGMTPLVEPLIVEAPDNQIKDPGGWSGFLIIAESHISIHTFTKRRFISADFYTCQNGIKRKEVVRFFREHFALGKVESHFIKRGLKYPAHNLL